MASPREQAQQFLLKAQDDWVALKTLLENSAVADEIVGFHAQQVIEKSLKAILAFKEVTFRKTHDLAELIDLCYDNKIVTPDELGKAVELTPFAVEFRYDFLPPEATSSQPLKREQIRILVQRTIEWAAQQIL
jgi:HEPN domain-containing protein